MTTLTAVLTESKAVSPKKIRDAIQQQVVSGKSLEVILLEMEALEEDQLNTLRAKVWDLKGATREEIMEVKDEVLKLVPSSVAKHFRFIPLTYAQGKLVVASAEPVPDDADTPLGFLLGYEIETRIANEVRIAAGLAKHYDAKLPSDHRSLLQSLDRADKPSEPAGVESNSPASNGGHSSRQEESLLDKTPKNEEARHTPFLFSLSKSERPPVVEEMMQDAAHVQAKGGRTIPSSALHQNIGDPSVEDPSIDGPSTGHQSGVDTDKKDAYASSSHPAASVDRLSEPQKHSLSQPPVDALALGETPKEENIESLVKRLEASSAQDFDALFRKIKRHPLDIYLPLLMQRFPGQLWKVDENQSSLNGRDISAIARALIEAGESAEAAIADLLCNENPRVRFYATLVASENPLASFVEPLGQRIFDADPEVRVLAIKTMSHFRHFEAQYARILEGLRAVALGSEYLVDARVVAVRALTELKDIHSLAAFVDLLGDSNKGVSLQARQGLESMSFQDFGKSERRWAKWVDAQEHRTHTDWIIDALTHSNQVIRERAFAAIQEVTDKNLDYHPSLGKEDRQAAQQRYRNWYEEHSKGSRTSKFA